MQTQTVLVYFGTATGIYASSLALDSGALSQARQVADTPHAGFLTLAPETSTLYAIHRAKAGAMQAPYGSVNAFRIDPGTGGLEFLNAQTVNDTAFVHINTDAQHRVLLAASYGDTRIACFPLAEDGHIEPLSFAHTFNHAGAGINRSRQDRPYPHSIYFDCFSDHVYTCDLGGDKVFIYRFDAETLSLAAHTQHALTLAPGAGPRHLAQHPNGRYLYVINELNGTLSVFEAGAEQWRKVQTVPTLPEDFVGENTTAEVAGTKDGCFLYGSNRGHDSLVSYRIDEATGRLETLGWTPTGGEHPRHFSLDPTGQFLIVANRDSDNVVIFRRNQQTGALAATGQVLELPQCICVKTLPLTEA